MLYLGNVLNNSIYFRIVFITLIYWGQNVFEMGERQEGREGKGERQTERICLKMEAFQKQDVLLSFCLFLKHTPP